MKAVLKKLSEVFVKSYCAKLFWVVNAVANFYGENLLLVFLRERVIESGS
jgi:hypothetical protein